MRFGCIMTVILRIGLMCRKKKWLPQHLVIKLILRHQPIIRVRLMVLSHHWLDNYLTAVWNIYGRDGTFATRRFYDENGNIIRDVHMTDHGNRKLHPEVPHEHHYGVDKNGKPKRIK